MKAHIDIRGGEMRLFHKAAPGVNVTADRIGPRVIRWVLDGPDKTVMEYVDVARKNGIPCRIQRDGPVKVYLAVPYTGREQRAFDQVNQIAGDLMAAGICVFSPISHCHPIASVRALPTAWEYWERFDREFISWCDGMVVVQAAGWKDSKGVTAELKIATDLAKPIVYIDPLHVRYIDVIRRIVNVVRGHPS